MPKRQGSLVSGFGIHAMLPHPWEGRIYRREDTAQGERAHPVMHLATIALPSGRGDYGTGAVELLGPTSAFMALLEFSADLAGSGLYAARGIPLPRIGDFAPGALQKRIAGQVGCQHFFTASGRAFCLFTVLGSARGARTSLPQVHEVLRGVTIDRRADG